MQSRERDRGGGRGTLVDSDTDTHRPVGRGTNGLCARGTDSDGARLTDGACGELTAREPWGTDAEI